MILQVGQQLCWVECLHGRVCIVDGNDNHRCQQHVSKIGKWLTMQFLCTNVGSLIRDLEQVQQGRFDNHWQERSVNAGIAHSFS